MLKDNYSWITSVLRINPLTSIMYLYRNILYSHKWPETIDIVLPLIWGIVLLLVGELVFKHLEGNFAEEL